MMRNVSSSKPGADSSRPALRRSNSLPARPPSDALQPTEVKTVRKSITRPVPDRKPPTDFRFGGGTSEAAEFKKEVMGRIVKEHFQREWLVPRIEGSRYYKDCLTSMHPKFEQYTWENKCKAYQDLAYAHPRLRAEVARKRNDLYKVPNHATSRRLMKPMEQVFLTSAMKCIQEDVARKPFHMHGESGITGDRNGNLVEFVHEPRGSVQTSVMKGDQFSLHNHRPFGEPFTSSASENDHKSAAEAYLLFNNKMMEYVTNGKDVMHIQPDRLELVKLIPDPRGEAILGKFPVAFRLPTPQQPPRPFSNHEAPATFRENWAPPMGWTRPEDYPRGDAPSRSN